MFRSPSPRSFAFTLVELLVVVAIIALLAGILLPVLGRIQDNARSTKCSSNLRQIGVAINAYASDNDGSLPGPLATWQHPIPPGGGAAETDKQHLCKLLAKYVGLNEDTTQGTPTTKTSIFICPSNERENPTLAQAVYVLNPRQIPGLNKPPFGKVEGPLEPVKKAILSNWMDDLNPAGERPLDLTRTWAMKDADLQAFQNTPYAGEAPPAGAPLKPVHGAHRNALFYDFHVGKLNADLTKQDQVQ